MLSRLFLTATILSMAHASAADQSSKESIERGQKLFVQSCGFCHGNDATGSRAPDLVRSAAVNHDESGTTLGPIIRNGWPDKGMPGLPMNDAQISDIAAFLHARVLAALNSSQVESSYPLERLLTGNSAAGEAFFRGAGGCTGCHSPSGDLADIARKYTPINLQQRLLYPSGSSAKVTVTLRSGKQFSGILAHADEFNVSLRDSSGWYRSWPRDQVETKIDDPLEAHRQLLYRYTDSNIHDLFSYLETLK
jgi:cytochrome c oxidase cbb3-type subunit 3